MTLRSYQQQCLNSLNNNDQKSLVNMWCGTGKTRIFTYHIFQKKYDLNVLVFPSLALINQYNIDYILNENYTEFSDYTFLSFCSDNKKQISDNKGKETYICIL